MVMPESLQSLFQAISRVSDEQGLRSHVMAEPIVSDGRLVGAIGFCNCTRGFRPFAAMRYYAAWLNKRITNLIISHPTIAAPFA